MGLKHIHRFDDVNKFRAKYYEDGTYIEPWLGLTETQQTGGVVSYNRDEESVEEETAYLVGDELTFHILTDGQVQFKCSTSAYSRTIQYSLNGAQWTDLTSFWTSGDSAMGTIVVESGDVVKFHGDNAGYGTTAYTLYDTIYVGGGSKFNTTCEFSVCGNIMSLIDSANFQTLTTLSTGGTFSGLFADCTNLVSAEQLKMPITACTGTSCFSGMFARCTKLKKAPLNLPTIEDPGYHAYNSMFAGCTALTSAPKSVPATTVRKGTCDSMFFNCTSLTKAPEIFATSIPYDYYNGGGGFSCCFKNCTSLVEPPSVLPCETPDYVAYSNMFENCTSLKKMPVIMATTNKSNASSYNNFDGAFVCMFQNTGIEGSGITWGPWATMNGIDRMFACCTGITSLDAFPYSRIGNFRWTFSGCTNLVDASHFLDNVTGDFYTGGTHGNTYWGGSMYGVFKDCTALTEPPTINVTALNNSSFTETFMGCTSLSKFPIGLNLATRIGDSTFQSTFEGCTSLTGVPQFNLASMSGSGTSVFKRTFFDCTSLSGSPLSKIDLNKCGSSSYSETFVNTKITDCPTIVGSAVTQMALYKTFAGCTSLTGTPSTISASTIGKSGCCGTFSACTSITTAPDLSAVTGVSTAACMSMFAGCTSLANGPMMPTADKVCYNGFNSMFAGCSSMQSSKELPATTLENTAYYGMFSSCTSMVSAQTALNALTIPYNAYNRMYANCGSLKDGPEIYATDATGGYNLSGMFLNCTSLTGVTSAIRITAATSSQPFGVMFSGCTSLQKGPIIYNNSGASTYAYDKMFYGCINLKEVGCLYEQSTSPSRFSNWMYGVRNQSDCTFYASSDAITNNYWSRGSSGVPSNWVITEYQPPV